MDTTRRDFLTAAAAAAATTAPDLTHAQTHDRIPALLGSPDRRDRIAAIGCRRKVAHVASIPAREPHR